MSTNKPSIGPVILEVAFQILKKIMRNFKISTQKLQPAWIALTTFMVSGLHGLLDVFGSQMGAIYAIKLTVQMLFMPICWDRNYSCKIYVNILNSRKRDGI